MIDIHDKRFGWLVYCVVGGYMTSISVPSASFGLNWSGFRPSALLKFRYEIRGRPMSRLDLRSLGARILGCEVVELDLVEGLIPSAVVLPLLLGQRLDHGSTVVGPEVL